MIASALALAATLAAFVAWWVRRRVEQEDSPEHIYDTQQETIDTALAEGPAGLDTINRLVDRGVALRLRPPSPDNAGDPSRSPNSIPAGQRGAEPTSGPLFGPAGKDAGNPPRSELIQPK